MTVRVSARITAYLLLALSFIWAAGQPAITRAQGGDPANPPPGAVIHVVQRDETLFGIALQYGSTVEIIAAANGITDPRYLAVGQRLLIPNAQMAAANLVIQHIFSPGDTLDTLAQTYNTTSDRIALDNHLTNPAQIFVGQSLSIAQNTPDSSAGPRYRYRVRPGDTLARVALAHQVSIAELRRSNSLAATLPLFTGQTLWIPRQPGPANKDLPYPLVDYSLWPIPAVQGQTMSIHVSTSGSAQVTGTFMGDLLQVVTQDATEHYALVGIHAFTAAGIYPLNIVATLPDGARTAFRLNVEVIEGGYSSEEISIGNQDLLNTDVTEPEWQRVATIMSGFTAQRYFEGMMGLPSSGAITSQFGTRRSYNGNPIDTFHSGTDFGAAPGSPITAPAAGVVVLTESLPVRGNTTIIDHGWGVLTGYWHQDQIQVAVGDVVTAGQVIGTVGSTGRSTGPHLHWEMWVSGVQVDPMQWVQHSFP